ncbi:MAG: GDP-L-fucose synthase [Gammaproteobacteria bacterium]|nr:GDP-L-fucose synthase [Gammaproteobacteria bacterium]
MQKDATILVAGSNGLVGSAVCRSLESKGYTNILKPRSKEINLIDQAATEAYFEKNRPDHVFMAAAKVGGINANNIYRADFIYENLSIASNVIHSSYKTGVKSLLFYGSSCIYPKHADQPMQEGALLTGELEPTNRPYALAKIAGIELCDSYNRQYGTDFRTIMPTNVYGIGDNFHLENSHVLPALVRKFHMAKDSGSQEVTLWGSGKPRREFIYADDLADAAVFIMNIDKEQLAAKSKHPHINVGCGEDISIMDLAVMIKDIVGFQGEIVWDSSMPDGTMRKLLDVSTLDDLGWKYTTEIKTGIEQTYSWFLDNQEQLRT